MTLYRYRANIVYRPEASEECPWNVGLYDFMQTEDGGYMESMGATDWQDALKVAYGYFRANGQEVIVSCGECGKAAPVDDHGRARDTVGGQPMCGECLADYLAEAAQ